jgi:hypothetical protein
MRWWGVGEEWVNRIWVFRYVVVFQKPPVIPLWSLNIGDEYSYRILMSGGPRFHVADYRRGLKHPV